MSGPEALAAEQLRSFADTLRGQGRTFMADGLLNAADRIEADAQRIATLTNALMELADEFEKCVPNGDESSEVIIARRVLALKDGAR